MDAPGIGIADIESGFTAVIRGRVPRGSLSQFVPSACGEVWRYAREAGLASPGRHLTLYLGEDLVECGVEVAAAFKGNSRIVCSRIPGGAAARAAHFGPYGLLDQTHAAIRQWCADHGHKITGICWELYGHWQPEWNNDASKIRTDVHYSLEPGSG